MSVNRSQVFVIYCDYIFEHRSDVCSSAWHQWQPYFDKEQKKALLHAALECISGVFGFVDYVVLGIALIMLYVFTLEMIYQTDELDV